MQTTLSACKLVVDARVRCKLCAALYRYDDKDVLAEFASILS